MCTLRTNQDQLVAALRHCASALAIDDTYCDTHNSYGHLFVRLNDFGRAVHHFNASLDCPFTNSKAYKSLMTLYDFMLRHDPQNASVYDQLASSQRLIGNTDIAMGLYRQEEIVVKKEGT